MKITIKNIIISLLPMFITNIISIGLAWYIFNDSQSIILITIILLLIFSVLPTIYLFFNYLKNNKNLLVFLYMDKMLISNEKNEKKIIYTKNIDSITFNGGKNIFEKNNIRFSTFDDFYYVEINTNDSEKIILTNLLSTKLKEKILLNYPKELIKYNYSFFSSIK